MIQGSKIQKTFIRYESIQMSITNTPAHIRLYTILWGYGLLIIL